MSTLKSEHLREKKTLCTEVSMFDISAIGSIIAVYRI